MKAPDLLVIPWHCRTLRVRHGDERITPYSQQGARIRAAVELASDVEGLRLVQARHRPSGRRRAGRHP